MHTNQITTMFCRQHHDFTGTCELKNFDKYCVKFKAVVVTCSRWSFRLLVSLKFYTYHPVVLTATKKHLKTAKHSQSTFYTVGISRILKKGDMFMYQLQRFLTTSHWTYSTNRQIHGLKRNMDKITTYKILTRLCKIHISRNSVLRI
jgi:hypothetical protein